MKVHVGLDVQLMRVGGWMEPGGPQALVSQQDSEIGHYHEIYLALLHLITAGQRELEVDLSKTMHWTHLTRGGPRSLQG